MEFLFILIGLVAGIVLTIWANGGSLNNSKPDPDTVARMSYHNDDDDHEPCQCGIFEEKDCEHYQSNRCDGIRKEKITT